LFAKVGYYESSSLYALQLVKGYHLLPGGPAGEWYRTFTFPFIGSTQASEGEASPQPNTVKYDGLEAHPCTCRWYCLTLLSEVSRHKLQMQQQSFCEKQAPRPWCLDLDFR